MLLNTIFVVEPKILLVPYFITDPTNWKYSSARNYGYSN